MPRTAERPHVTHSKGCPEQRIESYKAARPNGQTVVVVRCVDCGAHNIAEEN